MLVLGAVVFGLIIGSFLTVCIYRIPYGRPKGPPDWSSEEEEGGEAPDESSAPEAEAQSMSVLSPRRSICPECRQSLLWWHNIPVISWLLLRGRCGFCRQPISVRYPAVELLSAFFCVLSLELFGLTATGVLVYAFCCVLLLISLIDIDYYIIPDVISLPGLGLGLLVGAVNSYTHLLRAPFTPTFLSGALLGAVASAGVLFLIAETYYRLRGRVGLGMGDVKLLGMIGAFFGIEGAFYSMFLGSLAGSVIGILLMLIFRKSLTYQLPFGPYLALGALLYIFWLSSSLSWSIWL